MHLPDKTPNSSRGSTVIKLQKGRIPPNATDLEELVLCGILIDRKGLQRVADILRAEMFYRTEHQDVFTAAINLLQNNSAVDIRTVCEQLKEDGTLESVGGANFVVDLSTKVSSAAHIEFHARIVQQNYILRSLIDVSNQIIEKSYDETSNVFETIEFAETKIFEATKDKIRTNAKSTVDLLREVTENLRRIQQEGGTVGVESGFRDLDRLTSGFQASDLIVLAARPGMGKTALMLSMARNIAIDAKTPVAIFSLEMSATQLMTRLIAGEAKIPIQTLREGSLDTDQWNSMSKELGALEDAKIYIDETPQLSVFDMRAKARRLHAEHGIGIIFVDYLQLMTVTTKIRGENREQTISTISNNLKAVAKELDIPVIAISQLNRAVESREKKRPQLSDLRESGAIEQDADIVGFLYRPAYYNIDVWDDGTSTDGQAEIVISKHRNGSLRNIRLNFEGNYAKFLNAFSTSGVYGGGNRIPSKLNGNDDFPSESRTTEFDDSGLNPDDPPF